MDNIQKVQKFDLSILILYNIITITKTDDCLSFVEIVSCT